MSRLGLFVSSPKTMAAAALDLGSLKLAPRTAGALRRNRIRTVSQLMEMTEEDLLGLRCLGPKSVNEIFDTLARVP